VDSIDDEDVDNGRHIPSPILLYIITTHMRFCRSSDARRQRCSASYWVVVGVWLSPLGRRRRCRPSSSSPVVGVVVVAVVARRRRTASAPIRRRGTMHMWCLDVMGRRAAASFRLFFEARDGNNKRKSVVMGNLTDAFGRTWW
jgi:hypothetical protein